MKKTEEQLYPLAKKNDQDAWTSLYRIWRPRFWRLCNQKTAFDDLDEMVQECQIAMWKGVVAVNLENYHLNQVRRYVYLRANSALAVRLERITGTRPTKTNLKKPSQIPFSVVGSGTDNAGPDVLAVRFQQARKDVFAPDSRRRFHDILHDVDERTRVMAEQHYMEGYSQREIAEQWGLTQTKVSLSFRDMHEAVRQSVAGCD